MFPSRSRLQPSGCRASLIGQVPCECVMMPKADPRSKWNLSWFIVEDEPLSRHPRQGIDDFQRRREILNMRHHFYDPSSKQWLRDIM